VESTLHLFFECPAAKDYEPNSVFLGNFVDVWFSRKVLPLEVPMMEKISMIL
jgi:hypothetical protein